MTTPNTSPTVSIKIHKLAGALAVYRELAGLTIDEMAEKCHLDPEIYSRIEAGDGSIPLDEWMSALEVTGHLVALPSWGEIGDCGPG